MNKREALAKEFNLDVEDVLDKGDNTFSINTMEFLVLTNKEADKLVNAELKKSLEIDGIYGLPWDFRDYLKDEVLDKLNGDKLEELELKLTKQGLLNLFLENFEEYKEMLINAELIDENDTYTKAELKDLVNKLAEDIVFNSYEKPIDTLENDFGEEDFWKLMIDEGIITFDQVKEELRDWNKFDRGELLADYSGVEYPIEGTPYYYYRIK